MPWCPKCGYEYNPGIKLCPDCEEPLVEQLEGEEDFSRNYTDMVPVTHLENEIEGAVLKSVLEEQGIHAIVRDFIVSQHQLPEAGMNAWGELLVLDSDYDNAKFIITEYLNSLDTGDPIDENEDNDFYGEGEDEKD